MKYRIKPGFVVPVGFLLPWQRRVWLFSRSCGSFYLRYFWLWRLWRGWRMRRSTIRYDGMFTCILMNNLGTLKLLKADCSFMSLLDEASTISLMVYLENVWLNVPFDRLVLGDQSCAVWASYRGGVTSVFLWTSVVSSLGGHAKYVFSKKDFNLFKLNHLIIKDSPSIPQKLMLLSLEYSNLWALLQLCHLTKIMNVLNNYIHLK